MWEKENFEKRSSERGDSSSGGYHGIAALGKCHYNFLVPVFCLQFFRIMLSARSDASEKLFQIIVWCVS